jgi:hypothetical protein
MNTNQKRETSVVVALAQKDLGNALAICGEEPSENFSGHESWWWFLEDVLRAWAFARQAKSKLECVFMATAEVELAEAIAICADRPNGDSFGVRCKNWRPMLAHLVKAWGALHYAHMELTGAKAGREPSSEESRRAVLELRRQMMESGFAPTSVNAVAPIPKGRGGSHVKARSRGDRSAAPAVDMPRRTP